MRELLKEGRTARGLTQKAAAATARVDDTTWSRVETGDLNPSPATAKRMADAVGLSLATCFPDIVERLTAVLRGDDDARSA